MTSVRVPIHRTSPTQTVLVEHGATAGATFGVNLRWPDGRLVQAGDFTTPATSGGTGPDTTDALDEGRYNLYFTPRRAQDAVGAILTDSANVTLRYTAGSAITADLTNVADSGIGALLATTFDAKGRKTGSRPATITGSAGRVTVANGDASTGLPTIDLATVTDAGGGALMRFVRDAWGRITGTSTPTTTDLAEGTNLYFTDARADARIAAAKADANGIASLQGGKLDPGQLPALAITETFVVASQAAMLALVCQQGDVAVRTDLSKSFILTAYPPTTLGNWQELLTPPAGVSSFNGRTGSVVPASGDYTPAQVGAEPTIASGTVPQYLRGDKTWRDFATDVRAAVLTGLSTATNAVIAATDTVLGALGKLQAQISANKATSDAVQALFLTTIAGTPIVTQTGDFITVTN